MFSHVTSYIILKLLFVSYDLKSSTRWSVDRSLWWRSPERRWNWWTGRSMPTFHLMEISWKEMKLMNWKKYVNVSCSCVVYVLNLFCWVTLIYLKIMTSWVFFIFAFPCFFVTWKGCITAKGCFSKTLLSQFESFFLSLLLSAIIWYKQ